METMDTPVFTNPFEEVFRSVVEHAGAKTVFGEPVSSGGRTVVPVASVRYGFGGGSGGKERGEHFGGGGGGGLTAKPLGVFEINQSETRFIPISSNSGLIAAIALGICLGLLLVPRRRH
ncbi:MAG TPA: spore germination protein GerW family protein [Bryobacteraceae bacterium]|nr:spore germination protein GerW family protein [Bryobacteraceae bacterium]